jgi:hypothetical protein
MGVWDLSFGRDLRDKRILIVDLGVGLGRDLKERFDFVFENATVMFRYEEKIVVTNHLG